MIAPIVAGVLFKKICPEKFFAKASDALPAMAVAAITMIVACVVARNSSQIAACGAAIFAVVVLHNLAGLAGGLLAARMAGMDAAKTKAFSIEVGMQNSGLAASLAQSAFAGLAGAAVPAAIFSVWHNVSGACAAWAYRKWIK